MLDHAGDDPTRGWQRLWAYPADRDASCPVEQVEGRRTFSDCDGRRARRVRPRPTARRAPGRRGPARRCPRPARATGLDHDLTGADAAGLRLGPCWVTAALPSHHSVPGAAAVGALLARRRSLVPAVSALPRPATTGPVDADDQRRRRRRPDDHGRPTTTHDHDDSDDHDDHAPPTTVRRRPDHDDAVDHDRRPVAARRCRRPPPAATAERARRAAPTARPPRRRAPSPRTLRRGTTPGPSVVCLERALVRRGHPIAGPNQGTYDRTTVAAVRHAAAATRASSSPASPARRRSSELGLWSGTAASTCRARSDAVRPRGMAGRRAPAASSSG